MDARAAGCNILIRDGAYLVRSIDDILQAIYPTTQHPSPQPPLAKDQLIRDLKKPASHVAPAITELELSGRLERHPGGLLTRILNH
tara:strand:+ start:378 stop:635 length:258 start_codon:yes stop_codon:yes gene_type:complete